MDKQEVPHIYYVAAHDNRPDLADEVSEWLARGWKLQGGVSATTGESGTTMFYQAMVWDVGARSIR